MQTSRLQSTGCHNKVGQPRPVLLATCPFLRPGASGPSGPAQAQTRPVLKTQRQSSCPQAAKYSELLYRCPAAVPTRRPRARCQAASNDAESAAPSDSGSPVGDIEAAVHVDQRTPEANDQGGELATVSKKIRALEDEIAAVKGTTPRDNVLYAALLTALAAVQTKENQLREAAKGPFAEPQEGGQMVAEMKRVAGLVQELAGVVEAKENKPVFSSLSSSVLGKQTKQAQSTERVEPEFMVAMAEREVPAGMSSVIQALSGAQEESKVQEHLMAVINAACQDFKTIPEMRVVDTSTKGSGLPLTGYKDYIGKESRPDIVMSLTAQPWFPTMLGCLEVKLDLTKGAAHDDAVGQLRARVQQTRALVPDRKKFLGGVLDKREIQLWLFTPERIYHTDRVPIHWQKDDKGWQMLVGILAASYHRFGYVAPPPLPAFMDSTRELVQESVPIRVHPHRPVYQAQRQGEPVIVKLGDADSIQTEVDALTAVGIHPHLPTLCAHGELPSALPQGVTHYMVITPVGMLPKLEGGKTVGAREAKQRKRQFLLWLADVVCALEHMHNEGWLHRDPTPYNVVTASSTGAILLDLHLAVPASSLEASYRSGTAAFWALSLHSNSSAQHTASTDLEAVFYTFLYIASHGRALSWRYQDPAAMKRTKLTVMTDDDEWQTALSHCMEELRPTMSALRELFFPGGSLPAYKQHQVTVAEFKEAFKA